MINARPQRGGEHEGHIDQGARTDRGDDGDALRGDRHQPSRFRIERRHQFALGEPHHVGAVDDVVGVAAQRGARLGETRILMRQLDQFAHDAVGVRAVVADNHLGGTRVQFLDGGKPCQPERLAADDDDQSQQRRQRQHRAEPAQPFAAGI